MIEENPFENELVAKEWITSVENTEVISKGRTHFIYPLLKERTTENSPEVVVEIGAGQGICSDKLGENYQKYIGIEPSSFLLNRAIEKYGDEKREFISGNAYKLPLEDNCADFVFSIMVWFHLQDLDTASKELARVLKSGMPFLIVNANPSRYSTWQTFFIDPEVDEEKIVGRITTPGGEMEKNIIYKHSLDSILNTLHNAGLTTDRVEGFGYAVENNDDGIFIVIEGIKK